ncbi:hypothetical protein FSC05_02865 [Acinetobacter indicus]|uniref:Uncharacterized protein n=1 Tax=Acinetobacter indicus TaxID=756892 RepID=A0A7H8VHM4_9GAMM|nr:hypothetical protein FHP22_11930 [Acinetobacter indicus]QIC71604.1 hypothetical protein FSC09_02660 [Acinetobacter indicus]QIC74821.1 hypothetical protein FSC05_02865 [Acinetobacter indicus]QIC77463.1 hypothetical protein FSC17_10395 [Acinetobacter indicus]QIC80446.1 hypothetical protein FSC02_12205 [Acinetobacter indicus]
MVFYCTAVESGHNFVDDGFCSIFS